MIPAAFSPFAPFQTPTYIYLDRRKQEIPQVISDEKEGGNEITSGLGIDYGRSAHKLSTAQLSTS